MAKQSDGKPRKRFSRSAHTSHGPPTGPAPQYGPPQPPQYGSPPYQPPPQYGPPPYQPPPDPYGRPTYHGDAADVPPPSSPAVAMTKAAITQTNRAARLVTRKVISASKADGAQESGLTALIWNQVLSYGTDAMITVALAGTVFFGASPSAQRGNVLLYLFITMAPFAVVAPIIGPALDRLQHGRRWTMAGTAIGRGVLALVMASHPKELLILYPCALGSLVLSKAYGVVRAAAAPRLVPPGLTLTETNARLTIFGLGSTIVAGGAVGVIIKLSGSYSLGLDVTAVAFGVCAFFAFRLPPQIDSAVAAGNHPDTRAHRPGPDRLPPMTRLRDWAKRGFADHLIIALQGESVLRFLSGVLTIFMAFYIEHTAHGAAAAVQLGAVIGAAGVGNVVGTAIGSRVKLAKPDLVIVAGIAIAAVVSLLVGLLFTITMAVVGMFVSAVANSLSKIALDALIQRDVVESLRSSAFARSETFLQLSWVLGAAAGVLLPVNHGGGIGYAAAGVVVGAVAVSSILSYRAMGRGPSPYGPATSPGSVAERDSDRI